MAVARIDLYVELLCLEAVDRAVVEYFDVSVGWVQQQQQQLEQQQPEQQQHIELQQLVQRQREQLNVHQNWEESLRVSENIMQDIQGGRCVVVYVRAGVACVVVCVVDEHTDVDDGRRLVVSVSLTLSAAGHARRISRRVGV